MSGFSQKFRTDGQTGRWTGVNFRSFSSHVGGPKTDQIKTILLVLQKYPEKAVNIIRKELTYYRDTHKSDISATPELFQLNTVSNKERLENLSFLLSYQSSPKQVALPTPEGALAVVCFKHGDPEMSTDLLDVSLDEMCIT